MQIDSDDNRQCIFFYTWGKLLNTDAEIMVEILKDNQKANSYG